MKSRGIDVMLVAPGDRFTMYQELGKERTALEPPVWTGLLATFLRKKGYSVGVVDANVEALSPQEVAERIADARPVLTAIVCYGHQPNASTQVMPSAGRIAKAVKERVPESTIIMAGGHAAALPERTLREESVDLVATGEGPHTLHALLSLLKNGGVDYRNVPGVMYWSDGEAVRTAPAPNVKQLDREMPGVAWDLLPMHLYRAHGWHCYGHPDRRQPYASLYTTLGCPYACKFCPIQSPFRDGERALGLKPTVRSYRSWSPETVVGTLEFLRREYGVYNVKLADEMFVLQKSRVLKLCSLIKERGLDLNIWAYARVDTVGDDEELQALREAGFQWLCFGIESGDAAVRQDVDKGFPEERIFAAVERARRNGINVIANYLFGLPEDDFATMQRTLTLAMELNCEHANFYSAMAYPGSELYQLAIRKGWPLPEHWSGYSQHSVDTAPLPTNHLTGAQVLAFRDWAWSVYFTSPHYLSMIERKFGTQTVEAIRKKTSIKLVRQKQ